MDSGSREQPAGSDAAIRRSGRCRTASSMYAKSIDEFKKVEVGRWQSLRKPGRSLRFAEEDSGVPSIQREDSCSMDLEENALACRLPEADGHRLVWITVVGPQKPTRPSRLPAEPRSTTILKKKSSAFKEPPKEVEKKQSYLLGILLGAAIKVAHGPQEDQEEQASEQSESQHANPPEKPSENSNGDNQKKPESRQRSKMFERDEDLKKLGKMQTKFNSQSVRFNDLKNKLSVLT